MKTFLLLLLQRKMKFSSSKVCDVKDLKDSFKNAPNCSLEIYFTPNKWLTQKEYRALKKEDQ